MTILQSFRSPGWDSVLRPDLTVGDGGHRILHNLRSGGVEQQSKLQRGVYADWKPGSYFHVQPRAGYTIYQFQHTSQSAQIFDLSASGARIIAPERGIHPNRGLEHLYADLTVSHEISKAASYAFSAGHEIRPGIQSDAVEDWYFRPNITWTIIKDLELNTSFFYEHGNQGVGNVSGNLTETFDWYRWSIDGSAIR